MEITAVAFNELLNSEYIIVNKFREHSKASEKYVDVTLKYEDGDKWSGSIPYYYRRTGLSIEKPEELVEYLNKVYPLFTEASINTFVLTEKARWETEMKGKETTKSFFDILINLKWNSIQNDFPNNPNWARRIQDIKEFGYTLATDTNRRIEGTEKNGTHILLVPIPKGGTTGYEVFSKAFRVKALKALNYTNIYELSSSNKHALLPDHKFPEIRWDEDTKAENPDTMSDIEIKQKFQLLDNQRNQQKREVCRKCFQTNKRGKLFGLTYFYYGDENWRQDIPKIGKIAESGCLGCGWYDIQQWRESLNDIINKK